jgi:hypothetical protein
LTEKEESERGDQHRGDQKRNQDQETKTRNILEGFKQRGHCTRRLLLLAVPFPTRARFLENLENRKGGRRAAAGRETTLLHSFDKRKDKRPKERNKKQKQSIFFGVFYQVFCHIPVTV